MTTDELIAIERRMAGPKRTMLVSTDLVPRKSWDIKIETVAGLPPNTWHLLDELAPRRGNRHQRRAAAAAARRAVR